MKHRVNEKYRWSFNGIAVEGIIEYVGAHGIIASRYPHKRCKEIRQGDWVDLSDWNDANGYRGENYTYYGDFGRVDRVNYIKDGLVHVILNAGSCFLGPRDDWESAYVSISGGPFKVFYMEDLEPTMELRAGTYWNFRGDHAEADNGQDYIIERPVFKLKADARVYRSGEAE